MLLFDNLYQPVSWGSELQAHPFPGEGENYNFTLVPSAVFLTRPPWEQVGCFPRYGGCMPSCQRWRGGFLSSLRLSCCRCCSSVSPDRLLSPMPCSRQFLEAAAACAACWQMGRWQAVRQPRRHARRLSPTRPFEGQVSCTLALNSQLERSFFVFPRNNKEKEGGDVSQAAAIPALCRENKGSIFRTAACRGHLNVIPYRRRLWHMSAFTLFMMASC